MLATAQPRAVVTPEEYLAAEVGAADRHEYVAGQVYPMPGVSATHARLSRNLFFALEARLREHPCELFGSDLKLRLRGGAVYYYPDLMVCCDPTDDAEYWRERPRYVAEITSPETQRTDNIEKALAYFETPSIECYLQVSQSVMAVSVHRRADGPPHWVSEHLTQPGDTLRLEGIGFAVELARLYRRTGLAAE